MRFKPGKIQVPVTVLTACSLLIGLLALLWAYFPKWFAKILATPYPYALHLANYQQMLRHMPQYLCVLSACLAFMAFALASKKRTRSEARRALFELTPLTEMLLYIVLLAIASWFSWREWLWWQRPGWDNYWRAGEILHHSLRIGGAEVWPHLQSFFAKYPHSPSPLTPVAIALLMFVHADSILILQCLNLAATLGSLIVLKGISRRLAPSVPFWPVGLLFCTNAAVMRNSFFIQLDAINAFFVVAFFGLWLRWRDNPGPKRFAGLVACLVLGVFQKTTLFPLMAIPTLIEIRDAIGHRRINLRRLVIVATGTAIVPVMLFALYCFGLGIFKNFGTQLSLMGTGWNELDFSFWRFSHSTLIVLGALLPVMAFNKEILKSQYLAPALFIVLFFISIAIAKGPFWARYYGHVTGPCLILCLPVLAAVNEKASLRRPVLTYLFCAAMLGYWTMYLHLM
jgi:hypothetical protein